MLAQPFAYSKLFGAPALSFLPYIVGLVLAVLAHFAVARWQNLTFWRGMPWWAGAMMATGMSLLLAFTFRDAEHVPSSALGLLPIICWGSLIANDRASPESTVLSRQLTLIILSAWAIVFVLKGHLASAIFGLGFLVLTARHSPLRSVTLRASAISAGVVAFLIGTSPYRQSLVLR